MQGAILRGLEGDTAMGERGQLPISRFDKTRFDIVKYISRAGG